MAKYRGSSFGGGNNNMQELMRQAQKMQEEMQKVEAEFAETEYEATTGGGLVTIVLSGNKEMLDLEIKPEAVDPDDIEMLEDLIIAAYNDASGQANAAYEKAMAPFKGMM